MCVIRTFYSQFERNKMLLILVNLEKGKLCQKWPHLTLKWIDLTFSLISWPENKKTESFGQSNDQIRSTYSAWGSNSKIILMIRRWIFFSKLNQFSNFENYTSIHSKSLGPGPLLNDVVNGHFRQKLMTSLFSWKVRTQKWEKTSPAFHSFLFFFQ